MFVIAVHHPAGFTTYVKSDGCQTDDFEKAEHIAYDIMADAYAEKAQRNSWFYGCIVESVSLQKLRDGE